MLDLLTQGRKRGGELCLLGFRFIQKHKSELFAMRVCSKEKTSIIAEIVKKTQYFYMEKHLHPNWGVKTTTYHSKILATLSLNGPNMLQT